MIVLQYQQFVISSPLFTMIIRSFNNTNLLYNTKHIYATMQYYHGNGNRPFRDRFEANCIIAPYQPNVLQR